MGPVRQPVSPLLRLWALIQGLATSCVVAAEALPAAVETASDGFVLAQWTYHVTQGASDVSAEAAGPSGVYLEADNAAVKPIKSLWDLLLILPQATKDSQEAAAVNLARRGPGDLGGNDILKLLDLVKSLADAVRSDSFVSNLTNSLGALRNTTEDLRSEAQRIVSQFLSMFTDAKSAKEAVAIFSSALDNMTDVISTFQARYKQGLQVALATMSESMKEVLGAALNATLPEDASWVPSLPANVSVNETCRRALDGFERMDVFAQQEKEAQQMVNTAAGMLPMLKDFLTTTRPEAVDRVMSLMQTFVDFTQRIGSNVLSALQVVLTDVKPSIQAKLGCDFGAARPTSQLAPLALLLAVFAWICRGVFES